MKTSEALMALKDYCNKIFELVKKLVESHNQLATLAGKLEKRVEKLEKKSNNPYMP